MKYFGKLSIKGSLHFEQKMTDLLNDISSDIEKHIPSDHYKCVILIGGYGRGEGGVIKIQNIEYPHNNLDFLIVSKGLNKTSELKLKKDINKIIIKHCQRVDIDFDLSLISEFKLKACDPLVITYDMKYGHKVINGDSTFLKNMERFNIEYIPDWDIRNLMVNRGTLLTINDLILNKKYHTMKDIKTVIKHCVKAIIGYGDALLYYNGNYHYSYVEKQRRMSNLTHIDQEFRKMYDDAMSFRFEPNYDKYLSTDIIKFQEEVKQTLKKIHFQCEAMALKYRHIKWPLYFDAALNSTSTVNFNIKNILKNIYNLLLPTVFLKDLSFKNMIKAKMLGNRGLLPLLFPYIAFELQDTRIKKLLCCFFNIESFNSLSLKQQYLNFWGKHINNNFSLEEYGLEKGSL